MSRRLVGFVGALILALASSVASAQSGTSAISGTVRDSSGIGIPGAIVRVVNEDNQSRIEAVTNDAGNLSRGGLERRAIPRRSHLRRIRDGRSPPGGRRPVRPWPLTWRSSRSGSRRASS